jgi:biotin carboxyl carrier protein
MDYKVKHRDNTLSIKKKGAICTVNDVEKEVSISWLKTNEIGHLMVDNKQYAIQILKIEGKEVKLRINGKQTQMQLSDPMDQLLQNLGLDKLMNKGISQVKSPMPGLVLKVLVSNGQEVKKGDALLILEAMKMENVIKSPTDGVIKQIHIKERDALEKNKLMIDFV